MNYIKFKTITLTALFLSACGGGSSSSGNSEANVTNQCMQRSTLSGTNLVRFINSCDFVVNFKAVRKSDFEDIIENNIQPNKVIALELSLAEVFTERFILCKAPSTPNDKATKCI